uniref:Myeloid cell leukemia sequence 1b n=1 Tax=Iconisemion striatum TaxID=60296 RepID=A0A1A7XT37_9TELE
MLQRKAPSNVFGCFFSQNGVVNGRLHYEPGISTPHVPTSASLDSENGNVESGDGPKRPSNLEVTSHNGFAAKRFSHEEDEGSLPCTPECHTDSESEVPGAHAGDEVLDNDTTQLISRFLMEYTGLLKHQWRESKELTTMKRVVNDILEKHRCAYKGMVTKCTSADLTFIRKVAENMFSDGITNWGRIVSLLAFGAMVAQYQKDNGRENYVELVGHEISTYLLSQQKDFLIRNNSWQGFVEFFRVTDPESTVRNTLMAIAGVAGMGATLALLIR